MGDNWSHIVTLEAILPAEAGKSLDWKPPRNKPGFAFKLIAAKMACPPEDVGGVHGYDELVTALESSSPNEEQREKIAWLRDVYDQHYKHFAPRTAPACPAWLKVTHSAGLQRSGVERAVCPREYERVVF